MTAYTQHAEQLSSFRQVWIAFAKERGLIVRVATALLPQLAPFDAHLPPTAKRTDALEVALCDQIELALPKRGVLFGERSICHAVRQEIWPRLIERAAVRIEIVRSPLGQHHHARRVGLTEVLDEDAVEL